MEDKDEIIKELKTLIYGFGEATVALIDQMLKCHFSDPLGHKLEDSLAMHALGDALISANKYAEAHDVH